MIEKHLRSAEWRIVQRHAPLLDVVEGTLLSAVAQLARHHADETMTALFESDEGRRVRVTIEFDEILSTPEFLEAKHDDTTNHADDDTDTNTDE